MPVEQKNKPGNLGTDKKDSMKKRKRKKNKRSHNTHSKDQELYSENSSRVLDQAFEVLPHSDSLELSDSDRAEEKSKSDDKLLRKSEKNPIKKQKHSHKNPLPVTNRCERSNSPHNEMQVGGWGDAFRAAASIVDDSIVSSEDEACGDDGVLGISQFVCSRIAGNYKL